MSDEEKKTLMKQAKTEANGGSTAQAGVAELKADAEKDAAAKKTAEGGAQPAGGAASTPGGDEVKTWQNLKASAKGTGGKGGEGAPCARLV